MNKVDQEILEALAMKPEDIEPEEVMSEDFSPFNQPIAEKYIADESGFAPRSEPSPEYGAFPDQPLDAPEQVTKGEAAPSSESNEKPQEPETIPFTTAKIAADGLLGMVNNVLAVGGGFFVKIKKHKEFYDFEEVIQILGSQNEKNIRRIKLDEDDKALLSPLLALVIQKQAKAISPEQQLLAATLSILMKKAQTMMEIRAENQIFTERVLDIIREERRIKEAEAKEDLRQGQFEQSVAAGLDADEQEEAPVTAPIAQSVEVKSVVAETAEEEPESLVAEIELEQSEEQTQTQEKESGSQLPEQPSKNNIGELKNESDMELTKEEHKLESPEVPEGELKKETQLKKRKNNKPE